MKINYMAHPGTPPVIGVIGGSGIYDLAGLSNPQWISVDSPFGAASDKLLFGNINDQKIVFLPRHGRGHRISPSELNFRANIDVLKRSGVTDIISVSACGSFKEEMGPGTFVFVDQFIDRTFLRPRSFFGNGLVAHVSLAHPVCGRIIDALENSAKRIKIPYVRGGTYLAIEGPQFSTLAESKMYQQWNCDVVGMTNMPEARLAREAEMCYSSVAMVTDFDCWHPDHENASVESIVKVLMGNAEKAQSLVSDVLSELSERTQTCFQGCHTALDNSLITSQDARNPDLEKKLEAIAGRILNV